MMPPTPSTSASCSRVAARIASSEPNQSASARAATGPTCRMLSETSSRHSGFVLAFCDLVDELAARSPTGCGPLEPGLLLGCARIAPERGAHACRPVVVELREPRLGVAHDDLDRQEVVEREVEERAPR